MGRVILKAEHINKAFNGPPVLSDVSLSIESGEVHALVGGNGAGKSTLMKIITGIYSYDTGNIELEGKSVRFKNYREASENGIRMIFQELSLVPTLTVAENIFLNNEIKKKSRLVDRKKIYAQAKELLESLGVNISPKAVVGRLSVAEQQLIEIAKALSKKAKILLMDEPTASLSEMEVQVLFKIVERLKEQDVAVIYISHRMNEILKISDKVTVLRDGKIIITEEAKNLDIPTIIQYMMAEHANDFSNEVKNDKTGSEVLLEVKDLTVNSWVKNINFEVHAGEILGFAGLMNSGRTEILEGIFGLRDVLSGEVILEGKKVELNNPAKAIDSGIVLVPESRREKGLVLEHTLKTNISLPSLNVLKKRVLLDRPKIKGMVRENIKRYGIKADSENTKVSNLSGGNQQKVVFAKWLSTNPRLALFDEPTVGVDIGAKTEFIEIIQRFAAEGNAAIFVSSEVSELAAACDRIIFLNRGKICGELVGEEIENEEVIQNAIQQHRGKEAV